MAVTINADNGAVSGSAGLKSSADSTGVLALQTNGTTAVSISASQVVTLTNALPVASGGSGVTTSTGTGANVLGTTPSFTSTIGVGGATASASGSGISFPATQSASSDANTLDDYEEGTFTPTASGVTVNSGTPVYSGAYTKIGRIVFIRISQSGGDITLQGSGLSSFSGLPFTVATASTSNALWSDGSAKTGTVYAYEGSTVVYVLQAISTFTNLTTLRITATYQV